MIRKVLKLVFILLVLSLAVSACEDEEWADYIPVYIANHTGETLLVYSDASLLFLLFPSMVIPSGKINAVPVKKGSSVTLYGERTHRKYGSRSFYMEDMWDVY